MAFSYDSETLTTPLNHLRFLIQDTVSLGRFFEDAEIVFAATQETNVHRTAAGLCRAVAAKLSKTPSQDDATIKFEADKQAANYMKLAEKYDEKAKQIDASIESGTSTTLNIPALPSRAASFTRGLHFKDN